ncbi:hypothetical protein VNO78_04573 [Psophocarpus tetragonolobus]|uniref:Uncharacterized protein n=1 Tax=Psophocarpus tetragonolobus TaxID=3891 RepID=A0AAN9T4P4_PSOTE
MKDPIDSHWALPMKKSVFFISSIMNGLCRSHLSLTQTPTPLRKVKGERRLVLRKLKLYSVVFFDYTDSENTNAQQARNGKDIQGIHWERTNYRSREIFRQHRLERLRNDEAQPLLVEQARENYSGMLWSTSRHDLYFATRYKIGRWNALNPRTSSQVLDLKRTVVPSVEHPRSHMEGFNKTSVQAMALGHRLLIVGGPEGELICKHLDRPGVSFCLRSADREKINAIEIYRRPTPNSEAIHFMASNRDGSVKVFDVQTLQFSNFQFPWPVNHASSRPDDGRQLVVVGDHPEGRLVDSGTGLTIQCFRGHFGYSCSSAWHPDGRRFATGNRDRTCRIWDVRNLSQCVAALKGNVRAISSICFTGDGNFMAMSEDVDFVHVYDLRTAFMKEQEINFFGHVSGLSFSPDREYLFIGVSMDTFPTLLLYKRRRNYHHL